MTESSSITTFFHLWGLIKSSIYWAYKLKNRNQKISRTLYWQTLNRDLVVFNSRIWCKCLKCQEVFTDGEIKAKVFCCKMEEIQVSISALYIIFFASTSSPTHASVHLKKRKGTCLLLQKRQKCILFVWKYSLWHINCRQWKLLQKYRMKKKC